MNELIAWHFAKCRHFSMETGEFETIPALTHNDKRRIIVGETLSVPRPIQLCKWGLHASVNAFDALQYARSHSEFIQLCRVKLTGHIIEDPFGDKHVATERTVLKMLSIEETEAVLLGIVEWAFQQLIDVNILSPTVTEYMRTREEKLRKKATAIMQRSSGAYQKNPLRSHAVRSADAAFSAQKDKYKSSNAYLAAHQANEARKEKLRKSKLLYGLDYNNYLTKIAEMDKELKAHFETLCLAAIGETA